MERFSIVVQWTMTANIEVDAETLDEGEEKVRKQLETVSVDDIEGLPNCTYCDYLSDSLVVDGESETFIMVKE